ncbi:hypothetical protein LOD99_14566 [Oopsacas minuta]|uniref:Cytochrome P450 n=1 Tax=Oopsacas minuta TaxID=111878 RepID=A0AAV7KEP2_9METZ|nr:hypothetical protein LOD99_14566 [Oopsacas minuta]
MLFEYIDLDQRWLAEIITNDETWIGYDEPLSKERNMVRVVKYVALPLNPMHDFRDLKFLYSIFFDRYDPVAQIIFPKGKIITWDFYANNFRPEVEKDYRERKPMSGPQDM